MKLFGRLQNQEDEDETVPDNQLMSAEFRFSALYDTFIEVGFQLQLASNGHE